MVTAEVAEDREQMEVQQPEIAEQNGQERRMNGGEGRGRVDGE